MQDDQEPEVIRFLRANGLEMTPEQIEQVIEFQRGADEASDTMKRVARAYPIKRDMATLKARWEAKDPNIMATHDGEGRIIYERQFTQAQIRELEEGYVANRPPIDGIYPPGWSYQVTPSVSATRLRASAPQKPCIASALLWTR